MWVMEAAGVTSAVWGLFTPKMANFLAALAGVTMIFHSLVFILSKKRVSLWIWPSSDILNLWA